MEVWVQLKHQKCTHDLHTGADGSASTGDSPHSGEVQMEWCAVKLYEDESKTEGQGKNLPTFCNDLSSSGRC